MDCRDVSRRLSEYIDGMLDKKDMFDVEKHLERCARCREEYEELVRIIGHVKHVESLEPPEYFLQKVKKRMEKASPFEKAIKLLFFPLHIKIPLELAGAAAAALMVMYFTGIFASGQFYELTIATKAPAVTEALEEKQEIRDKEEKAEPPKMRAQAPKKGVLAVTDREKRLEKKEEPKKEKIREDNILEIVQALGGKILKSEYRADTHLLKSLVIEIPVDSFPVLLEKLEVLVDIQKPHPAIQKDKQDTVKIRITIRYPEKNPKK
jgi:hypothetical protein